MVEPSTSRAAIQQRRLRELPAQMRYLTWEARRLAPPPMHHELGDWMSNPLALVDQLHKIIEAHTAKPDSGRQRSESIRLASSSATTGSCFSASCSPLNRVCNVVSMCLYSPDTWPAAQNH